MYVEYFKYLAKHKWYVFVECCKLGVPLRGLLHDMSKFLPCEWVPYAHHFYGKRKKKVDRAYDLAWLHHIHRNKHHWQFWVIVDNGIEEYLPMPDKYVKEMLADWYGAGYAQNMPDVKKWYLDRKEIIKLHPRTRRWIEKQLGVDS